MKVYSLADELPVFSAPVVTLGSYDGVHYGHRVLLRHIEEKAREMNGESMVVTFFPHPRQILPGGGDIKLLNTLQEKIYLLEEAGVDILMILPFTPDMAGMHPREFIRDVMIGRLGMKWLVVGYDHHFGKGKEGDFEALQEMKDEFGFGADRIPKHMMGDDKVSSSVIRKVIEQGDMAYASELLTRGYIIIGDIFGGKVLVGSDAKLLPPAGKYNVSVGAEGKSRRGVLSIDHENVLRLENYYPDEKNVLITFI